MAIIKLDYKNNYIFIFNYINLKDNTLKYKPNLSLVGKIMDNFHFLLYSYPYLFLT